MREATPEQIVRWLMGDKPDIVERLREERKGVADLLEAKNAEIERLQAALKECCAVVAKATLSQQKEE